MKFISTIMWDLINIDEILKIICVDEVSGLHSYFVLKEGGQYYAIEPLNSFKIYDETEYFFCARCHNVLSKIIIEEIIGMPENSILDLEEKENELWEKFIFWAKKNKNKLVEKPKTNIIF